MKKLVLRLAPTLLAPVAAIFPSLAAAHPGHTIDGFMEGALHPFMGLDHLLAMMAVGILATRYSGVSSRWWLAPAAFASFMTIGALLGAAGVLAPHVESFIAISVVLLGAGIVFASRVPFSASLVVVAVAATLHGGVHGAEATGSVGPPYLFGMVIATSILHLFGIALAALTGRRFGSFQVRWFGIPISIAGVAMIAGIA